MWELLKLYKRIKSGLTLWKARQISGTPVIRRRGVLTVDTDLWPTSIDSSRLLVTVKRLSCLFLASDRCVSYEIMLVWMSSATSAQKWSTHVFINSQRLPPVQHQQQPKPKVIAMTMNVDGVFGINYKHTDSPGTCMYKFIRINEVCINIILIQRSRCSYIFLSWW